MCKVRTEGIITQFVRHFSESALKLVRLQRDADFTEELVVLEDSLMIPNSDPYGVLCQVF